MLAVPSTWRSDADRPAVVAVGVGDARASGPLVGAARDVAVRLGADLRIVHAGAGGSREVAALQREFAAVLADHPDLRVEWQVEPGAPEDALVAAADTASLVVVGRHHRKHAIGPHLGSTARAVLDRAACPVMVVQPG